MPCPEGQHSINHGYTEVMEAMWLGGRLGDYASSHPKWNPTFHCLTTPLGSQQGNLLRC